MCFFVAFLFTWCAHSTRTDDLREAAALLDAVRGNAAEYAAEAESITASITLSWFLPPLSSDLLFVFLRLHLKTLLLSNVAWLSTTQDTYEYTPCVRFIYSSLHFPNLIVFSYNSIT